MTERKRIRSDKDRAYNTKYKKEHTVLCTFRLNRDKDQDLIDAFRSIPNKGEFFREVLRNYIKEADNKTEDQ